MTSVDVEHTRVLAMVRRLFCAGDASRYGPFELLNGGSEHLTARIPGALYTIKVRHLDHGACWLSLFTQVDDNLAGRLWDQEVRVLLRIKAIEHPALPTVLQGGYDAEERLAWMVLAGGDRKASDPLNAEGVLDELRAAPAAAVGHMLELAEGLGVLHGHGVVHRNIWPGVVTISGDGADARLQLGRLEMSLLVTNLVQGAAGDPTSLAGSARRMMREGGVDKLRFLPPERLSYLLTDNSPWVFESDRGDVFGLAAMAWEWFLGRMPVAEHVDNAATDEDLLGQLGALHDAMRLALRGSVLLPRPLADLLTDMLRSDPTARPSSAEVVERLLLRYDGLMASFDPPLEEGAEIPRLPLVFFMPEQADKTLGRWGHVNHDPTSPEGIADQRELIERELAGAQLVHSPRGALDFVSIGAPSARRLAQWVFVGYEYAWFCVVNEQQLRGKHRGRPMPEVLRIMYVQPLHRQNTGSLGHTRLYRRISAVEALPYSNDDDVLAAVRARRPSWQPLLDQVRRPDEDGPSVTFLQGLDWLLDHQRVEQQLREYPFRRLSPPGADVHELAYDKERDLPRIRDSSLYGLLSAKGERAPFAQFFTSEEAYGDGYRFAYAEDHRGRPGPGHGTVLRAWMEGNDPNRLMVQVDKRSELRIPERGWLRPYDHVAARTNLARQTRALAELRTLRGLVGALRDPSQTVTPTGRWAAVGEGLEGDAPEIIRRMLGAQLFFALHGPPGTGKTTVITHAVEAYLRQESGARVLIAAQANDALDNLALRVLKHLAGGAEIIALRIGPNSERIDPKLHRWMLGAVTERRANRARQAAHKRIREARDSPAIRQILTDWIVAINHGTLELQDRLRRGASLVFATTSGSDGLVADYGRFALFDWVIVEEAAKAWPTELAIALVQGVRWTLVGDHRQLPAYRRDEVTRVIDSCENSGDDELEEVFERKAEYERAFNMFEELFSKPAGRPVDQLALQFRMREEIAGVVSRAFYEPFDDKPLQTHPTANRDPGVRRPARLAGRSFVWLDTREAESNQQPRWRNPAEAGHVARLLDLLAPLDRDAEGRACPLGERLAVLTPWRAQIAELKKHVNPRFHDLIHTIDSYQGREADIVVSSLVRDRVRSDVEAHQNLGHAVHAHRMNVMLSRARGLNIVVGSFDVFKSSGVAFWEEICASVGPGTLMPILEVLEG